MIRLKNNTGGYYSLQLEDSTGIKTDRTFIFPLPNSELVIPKEYAASIPVNMYAFDAYKTGLFLVSKGQEELDQLIKESGMVDDQDLEKIKKDITPDPMLVAALKAGTLSKVMEYYNSPNRDRLIQLAVDNCNEISNEKIDALEKASGLCIRVDE